MTLEHFGWISPDENPDYKSNSWNEREDDYASVAFWYQTGEPTFDARAPSVAERRLPSLERTIAYARDVNKHGLGYAIKQQLALYDGEQILYLPTKKEDVWIEIPFRVEEKAPLRLLLNMTKSYDFGIYQAPLNGVKLGAPMDFYSAEIVSEEFHLLDFWPDPGEYTLRLECVGKNALSQGHYLGIDSVRLRERTPRVRGWAHDKEKDWRVSPILYR